MVYTIYTIYYILLLFKNWQKEGTIAQWISLCLNNLWLQGSIPKQNICALSIYFGIVMRKGRK